MIILRYNLDNFLGAPQPYGLGLKGPIWSPTRLFNNILMISFVFLVPSLYAAIFRFRRKNAVTGIGKIIWFLTMKAYTTKSYGAPTHKECSGL